MRVISRLIEVVRHIALNARDCHLILSMIFFSSVSIIISNKKAVLNAQLISVKYLTSPTEDYSKDNDEYQTNAISEVFATKGEEG